jgi:hypothetical protein
MPFMSPALFDVLVKVYFNSMSGKGMKDPVRFIRKVNGETLCGVATALWIALKALETGVRDIKVNAHTLSADSKLKTTRVLPPTSDVLLTLI